MPKKIKHAKSGKLKKTKSPKPDKKPAKAVATETETLISSKVVYQGPLFRVLHDKLLEPGGKLEPNEDPLIGAQRELEEETGYRAKKWKPLVEYYGSPGFLGESMKVFLAEGLLAGDAHPEDDEDIDFRLVKLSEIVEMIEKGAIKDGKTLCSVLLYARRLAKKRKK